MRTIQNLFFLVKVCFPLYFGVFCIKTMNNFKLRTISVFSQCLINKLNHSEKHRPKPNQFL
jgi:hypothetical protein